MRAVKERWRSKEEARAAFRATARRLSDPRVQEEIEAEARHEMAKKRAEVDDILARSQMLGHDEFIR